MKKILCFLLITFPVFCKSAVTEFQVRLCGPTKELVRVLPNNVNYSIKKFETYYLESVAREFSKVGLSVRIRFKKDKVEVTVKKKYENAVEQISGRICEYDQHGEINKYSCKIESEKDKKIFERVLDDQTVWTELLSKEQLNLISESISILPKAVLFGTLINERFQWKDKLFGEVTFDLVEQKNKEEVSYHEISFRFKENEVIKSSQFLDYLQNKQIPLCENQIDWDVKKFDTLSVLN